MTLKTVCRRTFAAKFEEFFNEMAKVKIDRNQMLGEIKCMEIRPTLTQLTITRQPSFQGQF